MNMKIAAPITLTDNSEALADVFCLQQLSELLLHPRGEKFRPLLLSMIHGGFLSVSAENKGEKFSLQVEVLDLDHSENQNVTPIQM